MSEEHNNTISAYVALREWNLQFFHLFKEKTEEKFDECRKQFQSIEGSREKEALFTYSVWKKYGSNVVGFTPSWLAKTIGKITDWCLMYQSNKYPDPIRIDYLWMKYFASGDEKALEIINKWYKQKVSWVVWSYDSIMELEAEYERQFGKCIE